MSASGVPPGPNHACVVNQTRSEGRPAVRMTASQSKLSAPTIGVAGITERTAAIDGPTSPGSQATYTRSTRPIDSARNAPSCTAGVAARSNSCTTFPPSSRNRWR